MAGISWHYVLKFIITGACPSQLPWSKPSHLRICLDVLRLRFLLLTYPSNSTGDAAVGKSSLLIRLTDQRFLTNPDPTVRSPPGLPSSPSILTESNINA